MNLTSLPVKLLAAFLALVASFALGFATKGHIDGLESLKAENAAALADSARVTRIDLGSQKIETTFHVELKVIRQDQAKNVEEQDNAITQDPTLAQCKLPADLVRLRGEQAASSAAIASEVPVSGDAGALPASGPDGVH
jgi:hypothetical protein